MNDLLKMLDLSGEKILEILNLADQLKYEQKNGIPHEHLKGKSLGMIFEKSSTRTRVSFEVGMTQLGGYPLYLNSQDLQLGRGESIKDTARVLARYLDGIMIRTFKQEMVEELAEHADIPIINGLTDFSHPCQILADLMTIREYKGKLESLKMAYIGDGNNMANSLIVGTLKCGMSISVATPKGYEPDAKVLEFAKEYGDKFLLTDDINLTAKDADVVVTDTWASMGMETEKEERYKIFSPFQVDKKLMGLAKSDAIVLHCLPAYKGFEITEEVFEEHINEILEEAENRLHAQKAVMVKLMQK